ncbi:uncharacterized protein CANTADRAFT_22145 [Suhomyces tanzawaensis NRRL Y-17324]|uniref:RING-type domain-containing protein n=1 Tax=Suhomyces tanzawaensis NRRL Y-17324 TaxID=984487 RepID=A0A1E4SIZ4_9ASCO|nr:uncharacterized protein CANTADRAFT_22145 [Suhomyces tanzawaensis NRRL Y-17324]ODV79402.1 hypothetical protein CANTADRAFT_22145 [Suhomyces tanzawaensis NRRL Y-17324]
MSTYEEDHNITAAPSRTASNPSRSHQTLGSVLESFLTQDQTTESLDRESYTNALRTLNTQEGSTLALELIQTLEDTPQFGEAKSKGVPPEFLDTLERVPINKLPNKDTADCPICTNRFIDDKYPLLVKLPCGVQHGSKTKDHIFDLECIGPWLKVNSTCPLCRFDVMELDRKRREKIEEELRKAKEEDSEEEEEDWDVYG